MGSYPNAQSSSPLSPSGRTVGPNQYRGDWAYAARALEKGQSPEKVIKDMAAFRKDLPDPQKYAEATVAKVQNYLEVQRELGATPPQDGPQKETPDLAQLDKNLKQLSNAEFARRMYDDGAERPAVTEALQQERKVGKRDSANIATEAQLQIFAERDINYAVRARERGEPDERIVPRIAEYREGKVPEPQGYALAIVEQADRVREAERGRSPDAAAFERIDTAQEQYRRDLHHAVMQLESRPRDEVRFEIEQRRPERVYDSPSFRMHNQPDHSYAVAVVQQAERVREITADGRSLESTLDVAEREFGRHVHQAYNAREGGKARSTVAEHLSKGAPSQEFYARAVVNQADSIRDHQREISVRPEMARAALDQAQNQTINREPVSQAKAQPATIER